MRQDSQSFEERQKMIWDEMHERMERRRREWDDEVFSFAFVLVIRLEATLQLNIGFECRE